MTKRPEYDPLVDDLSIERRAAQLVMPALDLRTSDTNAPDASFELAEKWLDDLGVGGFLASPQNPNREWAAMAKSFLGKYKTPTLRNVDKRPRADFVKAYMHNGYLKSLKDVVHFYNTRDTLPKCKPGDAGEKITCWPAPENPQTINRKQLGDLKLTGQQEDMLVAFLKTLTDGYSPSAK